MSTDAVPRRPATPGRRLGYAIALVINALLLYAVNVWPGWQVVPFLTDETRDVLDLVNLSLIVGMITNGVYVFVDGPVVRALGDLITLGIGLAVLLALWQVFPFDFDDSGFDWTLLVRIVLGVALFGTAIGIVVQVVVLVRSLLGTGGGPRRSTPSE